MINYSLGIKAKHVGHLEDGRQWVACPQYESVLSLDDFAKFVSPKNIDRRLEIKAAIELIANDLRKCLRMGYKVDLGELGQFSIKFKGDPVEVAEGAEFNPRVQIKDIVPVWTPSENLKSILEEHSGDISIQWNLKPDRRTEKKVNKATKNAQTVVDISK